MNTKFLWRSRPSTGFIFTQIPGWIALAALCLNPFLHAQIISDGASLALSNVTNAIPGSVTVGTNGSFTSLTLSDNAFLTNTIHGVIGRNATAQSNEVQLLSATARWRMGNNLFIGSNGSFNRLVVSNGAFLNNNSGFLGNGASSSNNFVLVTGSGSFWTNRSDLRVGVSGRDNQMIVSNGARVVSFGGELGSQPGSSNNLAVVTGSGSVWTNVLGGWVSVGGGERGNRLIIEAGGQVGGDNGVVGAGFFGGDSEALVTGPGSLWSSRADVVVGLNPSNNRLVVSNGATVVAGNNGRLAGVTGSTGNVVVVTGVGSLWSNQFELYVGESGHGNRMEVNGGGMVVSSNTYVGFARSNNLALVTGAGSSWSNRAHLVVGASGGNNRLVVSDGAAVLAGGNLLAGLNSGAASNAIVFTDPGTRFLKGLNTEFIIGSNGPFNLLVISNGATAQGLIGELGSTAASGTNEAVVTGAGSAWRTELGVLVGRGGAGNRLRIADGATVSGASGFLGYGPGANNEAFLNGLGAIWTNQLDFYVGFQSSGNRLAISNGATLHANDSSYLGYNPGSAGNTATISGPGSVWRSANRLVVGDFGASNRLTANAGAALIVGGHGVLGVTSGSSNNNVIVAMPGTTLTVASNLFVGSNGAFNVMTLATGASATVGGDTYIGSGTNGNNNTLAVSDAGTVWTNQGTFQIGGGSVGRNLLAVINGAVVRGFMSVFLGVGGPNNEVIVGDPGSLLDLSSQTFYVGLSDAGNQVTVRDGGVIRSSSGQLGALTFGSNALVTVTGPGAMWQLTGFMLVGLSSPGHRLIINNGGAVETLNGVGVGQLPSSTNNRVTVDGGVLRATNVSHTAGLNVIRGTNVFNAGLIDVDRLLLTNAQGFFEFNGGTLITHGGSISNGTPFVVGRGGSVPAIWDLRAGGGSHALAGRLTVGSNASFNQVFITNGATLTGGEYTFLALTSGSNNAVTVSGPGSTLNSPSGFFVGADGNANGMHINNGGKAIVGVGSAGTFIGRSVGTRSNAVTVADPGSRWSVNDTLYVGSGGHGNRMVISNAAAADSLNGYVGNGTSGSNNLALVTGANSSWSNRSDFYVGASGSGNRLIVTDGGTVIHSNAFLGLNSSSLNNTVEVSGGGSRWSSHTDLTVGYDGSGNQMSVLAGAVASVGRNLLVGRNPVSSSGNRLLVDGGTLVVTNGAVGAVLEINRGTNVLNAGLIEADILRMTNGTLSKFEFNGGTLSARSSRIIIGPPLIIGNGINPATFILAGNGTHDMTGTLGLIVTNNATLTGNGSLLAQLQIRPGAILAPGTSIGKISLSSPPILQGATIMEIGKTGAILTNDQVQVTGTLTYGGTLTVTHLGPGTLAAGDKFQLFNATAYAGSFTSLTLPLLSPPLFWKTNLLTDGSLEVAAPPAIALSSGSYTQRFDSLASTGVNHEWRDNVTLVGWYAAQSLTPFAITDYLVSDGSFNSGGLYSFGVTGSVDHALGSIASNNRGTISYGLGFLNDTPEPARDFTLTWTGEQWRGSESGTSNTLTFWYRVSPVALTSPEPDIFTNWTEVTNLNFTSPTVPASATPLDGNQATNQRVFTAVTISGLEVPPGQSVFFRWHDVNDGGSDHGMAVDDLTVSFNGPALNAPIHLTGQALPGSGAFQINFTNLPGAAFTVLASDDPSLKLTNWTVLGTPTEIAPGEFRLTDPAATNQPRRYYIIRAP